MKKSFYALLALSIAFVSTIAPLANAQDLQNTPEDYDTVSMRLDVKAFDQKLGLFVLWGSSSTIQEKDVIDDLFSNRQQIKTKALTIPSTIASLGPLNKDEYKRAALVLSDAQTRARQMNRELKTRNQTLKGMSAGLLGIVCYAGAAIQGKDQAVATLFAFLCGAGGYAVAWGTIKADKHEGLGPIDPKVIPQLSPELSVVKR